MLTTPLYSASAEYRAITDCFLLDQQMGPELKLRVYPDVDLRLVLLPALSESVKPMRSNVEPDA